MEFCEDREEALSHSTVEMDCKLQSEKEFTAMATEVRKNFYAFHKAAAAVSGLVESVFPELKKHLSFKLPKILDHPTLADYFERQLFKLAKNHKQAKKNWSEEETVLLISVIVYYCLLQNEDYSTLVCNIMIPRKLIHYYIQYRMMKFGNIWRASTPARKPTSSKLAGRRYINLLLTKLLGTRLKMSC